MTESQVSTHITASMASKDDEQLKKQVQEYWNAHPCGTQFTPLEWGSRQFFEETERFRYQMQPFMYELAEFDCFRGKKLLEVGCGLGTDLLQFARHGSEVTGIDLTPQSIELAKRRFQQEALAACLLVSDAENLPFGDAEFDAVYSFGVLHHTPNTEKAVGEIFRVLKPGGRLIIMLYHRHSLHVALGAPLYALMRPKVSARRDGGEKRGQANWIRIYDGSGNPLGKAYTRKELEWVFRGFHDRRFRIYDSYRRRFPRFLNLINQKLLAPWWGFWIVLKAVK